MNNNNIKIIALGSLFLLLPSLVFAQSNFSVKEGKNQLSLEGGCIGNGSVRVDLFLEKNNKEPIYTSGSMCENGKFKFEDNLLQWESLPDGKYIVIVDRKWGEAKTVSIERPVEKVSQTLVADVSQTASVSESASADDATDVGGVTAETPDTKFLSAFVGLQQSILDMRTWISETNYPKTIKDGISLGLDGMDAVVGKLSDLVVASQDEEVIVEEVVMPEEPIEQPQVAGVTTETPKEIKQVLGENSDIQLISASQEVVSSEVLNSDGLEISGNGAVSNPSGAVESANQ